MPRALKATNQEIIDAYQRTGSVWAAGKELGIVGQSVHERLVALGYAPASRKWSEAELAELRSLVESEVPLGEIAKRLGRPYAGVAGKASELELRSTHRRRKKLPRGAGYDKATVKQHVRDLGVYKGSIRQFARSRGLGVEPLIKAIQQYFPEWWAEYVATHSDIPSKECAYCGDTFYPMNGKQVYCQRKCAADARTDRNYFGGKRKFTVGLAEGVCQLCGRRPRRGLTPHHVRGKENDPDNEDLVALCPGCHQIVTLLGGRDFVTDEATWQALISLAWIRKHGDIPRGQALYVEVDIELMEEDDDD